MKTIKNIFVLVTLLFCANLAVAQNNENTLLWKVEGNGIKTSYVFGTFHMLPKKDFILKDKVKDALEASALTVLELDMDDPSFQSDMMQHAMIKDGVTLSEFMDADEYKLIDAYLTEKMGVGLAQFTSFKPLMVSSAVMMAFIGKDIASYEGTIIELSTSQGNELKGLETVAYQMSVFDEQPYEEQVDDIVRLLEEEGMSMMFENMIALYKKEDIDGLYAYMDDFFNGDAAQLDRMLHTRNKNWIPKIAEYSKNQATFYGVGAGHLGGTLGVVNLLREAGYTVTPILD